MSNRTTILNAIKKDPATAEEPKKSTEDFLRERIDELQGIVDAKLFELQQQADLIVKLREKVSAIESSRDSLVWRVAYLEANGELLLHAPQKTNGAKYVAVHKSIIFETTDEAINDADKYGVDDLVILSGHIVGRIDYQPVFIPNEAA